MTLRCSLIGKNDQVAKSSSRQVVKSSIRQVVKSSIAIAIAIFGCGVNEPRRMQRMSFYETNLHP